MTQLEQSLALQMMNASLPEPEREYPTGHGKCRVDFAWPELMLAVEVEGGTWANGRHSRGAGYARDCDKYNAAQLAGWMVIRVTSDMVRSRKAIDVIRSAHAITSTKRVP